MEGDDSIALLPDDTKHIVPTNYNKCIICQSNTSEPLRKAMTSSLNKFMSSAEARNDLINGRIKREAADLSLITVLWHAKCYSSYTSKWNIDHVEKRKRSISPTPSHLSATSEASSSKVSDDIPVPKRLLRSPSVKMDWDKCLFCKKKTHKKVKTLVNVCTLQVCDTIQSAADSKGDDELLLILNGVNNDLIAAKAKYHRGCFASYTSKVNPKSKSFQEPTQEDKYAESFEELALAIQPNIEGGKAYNMTNLLLRYKTLLGTKDIQAQSYSSQRFKQRLDKFFGESIVFHQPYDRAKPELVYSTSVSLQDVINAGSRLPNGNQTDRPVSSIESNEPFQLERHRVLYRAAMMIKSEIKEMNGISIQPLKTSDLTVASAKRLIPETLYWLLRWIISPTETDDSSSFEAPECTNVSDERRVLMICQDIIHSASHARIKTPKHTALAMAIRHLTGSKQLTTMLNRMGHCSSYDTVEIIDTALAKEVIARAEDDGIVVPSNITHGSFVQFAADNNDINEETLDGKESTHATVIVAYQKGNFGTFPTERIYADHSQRKKVLSAAGVGQIIYDFGVHGKRPRPPKLENILLPVFDTDNEILLIPSSIDLAWALVRLCPITLFTVETMYESADKQLVPGWGGFNTLMNPSASVVTKVGFCPMINASSNDYSTIYTVLKTVQKMVLTLGQPDCVITFDLLIYMKAKEIQWRVPDEFDNVVIRMGGFHIALNYLSVLGKMFDSSGLEDLLVEAGVYACGTASQLLKGKQYNRGVRAHKLVSEVMFRLKWRAFLCWLETHDQTPADHERVQETVGALRNDVCDGTDITQSLENLISVIAPLRDQLNIFQAEGHAASQLFAFWDSYIDMVNILLHFIRAERSGDWLLHLAATAEMCPYFYAMDRMNYARWLPIYLADMNRLHATHPAVYDEFIHGNHAVTRSKHPFAQVWTDMALEQTINRDSKSRGGISGISKRPEALERWFLTSHERAAITTSLRDMCGIDDSEQVGTHTDCSQSRITRDETDVLKLIAVFDSHLMINPFHFEGPHVEGDEPLPLTNFVTGVVAPENVTKRLLTAKSLGKQALDEFVTKRLECDVENFWDAIHQLKIQTFSSIARNRKAKTADEKVVSISADRDFFGRLVIVAKSRSIDLKDVLSYELSAVPFSLAHKDGTLRKTDKSVLIKVLESKVDIAPTIPVSHQELATTIIIDGMAMIQMLRSCGCGTFGDLSIRYYDYIRSFFKKNGCRRIDIVFDSYRQMSIKAGEKLKRGSALQGVDIKIHGPATPIPSRWEKYISNENNKKNMCSFLVESWCDMGIKSLAKENQLIIGGGFHDNEKTVLVQFDKVTEIPSLRCDHEEADTRLILHCKHASTEFSQIIIHSPDTDVLILCLSHFRSLACTYLWLRLGVRDKMRFIPFHSLAETLGNDLCLSLLGFHALTGCDTTSCFFGIGKKKAWNALEKSVDDQRNLHNLGGEQEVSEDLLSACKNFICKLYTVSSNAQTDINHTRYWLFCQKRRTNETLPPTNGSFKLHVDRVNYQTMVWVRSLLAKQELPPPTDCGWEMADGRLRPVLMSEEPAPKGLVELTSCNCKKTVCATASCMCGKKSPSMY